MSGRLSLNVIPLATYTEEQSPMGGAPWGVDSSVPGGPQAEASWCQLGPMTGTPGEAAACSQGVERVMERWFKVSVWPHLQEGPVE